MKGFELFLSIKIAPLCCKSYYNNILYRLGAVFVYYAVTNKTLIYCRGIFITKVFMCTLKLYREKFEKFM